MPVVRTRLGHLLTVGLVWNKWVNLQFVFTRQVSHPWPFWVKIPDPSSFRSLTHPKNPAHGGLCPIGARPRVVKKLVP